MTVILVPQAIHFRACTAGDVMWHRLWLCDDSFRRREVWISCWFYHSYTKL